MSDATAHTVDEEVRRIVDTAYNTASSILQKNFDQLHTLAKGLLEYETLSGEEIHALLRGETIVRVERNEGPPPPKPSAGRRTSVPTTGTTTGTKDPGMDPEPQGT